MNEQRKYKVIIIDDEPWTIIDIEHSFEMDKLGFEIIGTYRSSVKALAQIRVLKPDLVITDIRMPVVSGLELMKILREEEMECEFIIVSGYNEFIYAQEAIQYGAAGYCLKPLDPEEANSCLERIRKKLDLKAAVTDKEEQMEFVPDHYFQMIQQYMITHFSEKITLKSLSAAFNLNSNYCCSLFNKHLDKTFSQYLTEIRISEAMELLRSTELSLNEIAEKVGFSDYFYFSKVFKKSCGFSPKEYRIREWTEREGQSE